MTSIANQNGRITSVVEDEMLRVIFAPGGLVAPAELVKAADDIWNRREGSRGLRESAGALAAAALILVSLAVSGSWLAVPLLAFGAFRLAQISRILVHRREMDAWRVHGLELHLRKYLLARARGIVAA